MNPHVFDEVSQCDEQCGNPFDHQGHQSSHIPDQTSKEWQVGERHYTVEVY